MWNTGGRLGERMRWYNRRIDFFLNSYFNVFKRSMNFGISSWTPLSLWLGSWWQFSHICNLQSNLLMTLLQALRLVFCVAAWSHERRERMKTFPRPQNADAVCVPAGTLGDHSHVSWFFLTVWEDYFFFFFLSTLLWGQSVGLIGSAGCLLIRVN